MILTVTLNAAIDKRYVVDDFKAGEVNRVRECSYVPGGKGLNVSKPASIYGAEVVATGFVGGRKLWLRGRSVCRRRRGYGAMARGRDKCRGFRRNVRLAAPGWIAHPGTRKRALCIGAV